MSKIVVDQSIEVRQEIRVEQLQPDESNIAFDVLMHKGCYLWALDMATSTIYKLEQNESSNVFRLNGRHQGLVKKYNMPDGLLYERARDLKNASRKFNNQIKSLHQKIKR